MENLTQPYDSRVQAITDTLEGTVSAIEEFDASGPEDEVYLPAGVYRTGALRLHGDMALHLDEGAVLQGTDRPEDYLPRIRSRFEGIEQECYLAEWRM